MTAPTHRASRIRRSPAERVRDRLSAAAGADLARLMPSGYQRLGRVVLVQRPSALASYDEVLGNAWQHELGVETVLVKEGPIEGEFRTPRVRCIAGHETETEVVEHGVRWRFDAAKIMFAAGNRTERWRAGRLVHPGETVADLFAGIGYFTVPSALPHRASRVYAVEKNPVAVQYLNENVRLNGVERRVSVIEGDNRSVMLPDDAFDRVFLGYLPDARPWIVRSVALLRSRGGWVHVHTVEDVRTPSPSTIASTVAWADKAGARLLSPPRVRNVKPYGPGREHRVVDLELARR